MAFNRREVIFDYQGEEEEKQYNYLCNRLVISILNFCNNYA